MNKQWNILVVDDEKIMRESLTAWLREDGYSVSMAASGTEAIELARDTNFAICFIDLKMPPGPDGITTMIEIQKIRPKASAIIITAYATVDTAIAAMKEGAQEYIVKPCNPQEISLLVERIIKLKNLERANALLRKKLLRQYEFHDILSKNPRMAEIFTLIKDVAGLKSTARIQGGRGTGEEMVARATHRRGGGERQTLRGRTLRRTPRIPARVGALRVRARGVHRRHGAEKGEDRAGRRGDAVPG